MATFLYVFPHPDDESFGPAPALARQRREGHAVHLLTLTRGEATKERHKHGLSKPAMGAARYDEMQDVAEALDLSSLEVLGLPDGGLAGLNPLDLEAVVRAHVERVAPDVLVTYAVHGISGHHDHLVSHAVVKRVACAMQAEGHAAAPSRVAFFTLPPPREGHERVSHLKHSPAEAIGAVVPVTEGDLAQAEAALACYRTYQDVVQAHDPLSEVRDVGVCFELFGETHDARLTDLAAGLC